MGDKADRLCELFCSILAMDQLIIIGLASLF